MPSIGGRQSAHVAALASVATAVDMRPASVAACWLVIPYAGCVAVRGPCTLTTGQSTDGRWCSVVLTLMTPCTDVAYATRATRGRQLARSPVAGTPGDLPKRS